MISNGPRMGNDGIDSLSCIDEIITYKEKDSVVYGYLNQNALDKALYNRAKERTHNFTEKDKWEDERNRRSVKFDDISMQKHSVLFRTFDEGGYISKGDILLDLGLDSLSSSNYFRENNISQLDTLLCCGIKIFSCYSGYISDKIEDNIVCGCNLGKTIKDGDLLFTIKLASKPKEEKVSFKDIWFEYNLLTREFLEHIPYLTSITISKWFVDNYTKVEEGDDLLEVTELSSFEPKYKSVIKSPSSGLLFHKHSYLKEKLAKGNSLFRIYSDETALQKGEYPNEISVTPDEFTKDSIVKGKICGGSSIGFCLESYVRYDLTVVHTYINFENVGGKYYLSLQYNKKDVNLNKKCTLHLLLEGNNIITLNAVANPIKVNDTDSKIKYLLTCEDSIKLEKNNFIKWQITNEEGVTIKTGYNGCCLDRDDKTGFTQKISYEVFRNFMVDFNSAIRANIPEKDHKIAKDSCYVYLMVDTTNNFHKIGISNNPKYREHTLQSDKPTIELLCAKKYPSRTIAEAIEFALHKAYANKRIRGEWFNLDASDVEDVKRTLK